jgi:hypothetical protein
LGVIEKLDGRRLAEVSFEIVQLLALALVAKGYFTKAELLAIFEPMEEKAISVQKKESTVLLQSLTTMLSGDNKDELIAVMRNLMQDED